MSPYLIPRHDVGYLYGCAPASRYGTTMTRFHEHLSHQGARDGWSSSRHALRLLPRRTTKRHLRAGKPRPRNPGSQGAAPSFRARCSTVPRSGCPARPSPSWPGSSAGTVGRRALTSNPDQGGRLARPPAQMFRFRRGPGGHGGEQVADHQAAPRACSHCCR